MIRLGFDGTSAEGRTGAEAAEPSTPAAQLHRRMALGTGLKRKLTKTGFLEVNESGLTTDWNDGREKPLFISDFPFE